MHSLESTSKNIGNRASSMAVTSDTELVAGEWWLDQLFVYSIVAVEIDKLEGWAP